VLIAMHAGAISSLIVADWMLHYIIQNFKRFFLPPEISMTQHASFPNSMDAAAHYSGQYIVDIMTLCFHHAEVADMWYYTEWLR